MMLRARYRGDPVAFLEGYFFLGTLVPRDELPSSEVWIGMTGERNIDTLSL